MAHRLNPTPHHAPMTMLCHPHEHATALDQGATIRNRGNHHNCNNHRAATNNNHTDDNGDHANWRGETAEFARGTRIGIPASAAAGQTLCGSSPRLPRGGPCEDPHMGPPRGGPCEDPHWVRLTTTPHAKTLQGPPRGGPCEDPRKGRRGAAPVGALTGTAAGRSLCGSAQGPPRGGPMRGSSQGPPRGGPGADPHRGPPRGGPTRGSPQGPPCGGACADPPRTAARRSL